MGSEYSIPSRDAARLAVNNTTDPGGTYVDETTWPKSTDKRFQSPNSSPKLTRSGHYHMDSTNSTNNAFWINLDCDALLTDATMVHALSSYCRQQFEDSKTQMDAPFNRASEFNIDKAVWDPRHELNHLQLLFATSCRQAIPSPFLKLLEARQDVLKRVLHTLTSSHREPQQQSSKTYHKQKRTTASCESDLSLGMTIHMFECMLRTTPEDEFCNVVISFFDSIEAAFIPHGYDRTSDCLLFHSSHFLSSKVCDKLFTMLCQTAYLQVTVDRLVMVLFVIAFSRGAPLSLALRLYTFLISISVGATLLNPLPALYDELRCLSIMQKTMLPNAQLQTRVQLPTALTNKLASLKSLTPIAVSSCIAPDDSHIFVMTSQLGIISFPLNGGTSEEATIVAESITQGHLVTHRGKVYLFEEQTKHLTALDPDQTTRMLHKGHVHDLEFRRLPADTERIVGISGASTNVSSPLRCLQTNTDTTGHRFSLSDLDLEERAIKSHLGLVVQMNTSFPTNHLVDIIPQFGSGACFRSAQLPKQIIDESRLSNKSFSIEVLLCPQVHSETQSVLLALVSSSTSCNYSNCTSTQAILGVLYNSSRNVLILELNKVPQGEVSLPPIGLECGFGTWHQVRLQVLAGTMTLSVNRQSFPSLIASPPSSLFNDKEGVVLCAGESFTGFLCNLVLRDSSDSVAAFWPMNEGTGCLFFDHGPHTCAAWSAAPVTWHKYSKRTKPLCEVEMKWSSAIPFALIPEAHAVSSWTFTRTCVIWNYQKFMYMFEIRSGILRCVITSDVASGGHHYISTTGDELLSIKMELHVALVQKHKLENLYTGVNSLDLSALTLGSIGCLSSNANRSSELFTCIDDPNTLLQLIQIVQRTSIEVVQSTEVNFAETVTALVLALETFQSVASASSHHASIDISPEQSLNLFESIANVYGAPSVQKCPVEAASLLSRLNSFVESSLDVFFPSFDSKVVVFKKYISQLSSPRAGSDVGPTSPTTTQHRNILLPTLWRYFSEATHAWMLYNTVIKKDLMMQRSSSPGEVLMLQAIFVFDDEESEALSSLKLLLPLQNCIFADQDSDVIATYASQLLQHVTACLTKLRNSTAKTPIHTAFEKTCLGKLLHHFATCIGILPPAIVERLLVVVRGILSDINSISTSTLLPTPLPTKSITERVHCKLATPHPWNPSQSYDWSIHVPEATGPFVLTFDPRTSAEPGTQVILCEYGQTLTEGRVFKHLEGSLPEVIMFPSSNILNVHIRFSDPNGEAPKKESSKFGVEMTLTTSTSVDVVSVDWFSDLKLTLSMVYAQGALALLSETPEALSCDASCVDAVAGGLRCNQSSESTEQQSVGYRHALSLAKNLIENVDEGAQLFENLIRGKRNVPQQLQSPLILKTLRHLCAALIAHEPETFLDEHFDKVIRHWNNLGEIQQQGDLSELESICERAAFLALEVQGTTDATKQNVQYMATAGSQQNLCEDGQAPPTGAKEDTSTRKPSAIHDALERFHRGVKRFSLTHAPPSPLTPTNQHDRYSIVLLEFMLSRNTDVKSLRQQINRRAVLAKRHINGMYALTEIISGEAAKATVTSEMAKKLLHKTDEVRRNSQPICSDYCFEEILQAICCSKVTERHYHTDLGSVGADLEAALRKQFGSLFKALSSAIRQRVSLAPQLGLILYAYPWRSYDASLLHSIEPHKVLPEQFSQLLSSPTTRSSYVVSNLHEPYHNEFSSNVLKHPTGDAQETARLSKDKLTATFNKFERVVVRAEKSFNVGENGKVEVFYFEMNILQATMTTNSITSSDGEYLIGFSHDADSEYYGFPESDTTYAYLSVSGNKQNDSPMTGATYASMYGPGDVVGCGFFSSGRRAFFTKNGAFMGFAFTSEYNNTVLPIIGCRSNNASIRMNFGLDPFVFDVSSWLRDATTGTVFYPRTLNSKIDLSLGAWNTLQCLMSLTSEILDGRSKPNEHSTAVLSEQSACGSRTVLHALDSIVDLLLTSLTEHVRSVAVLTFLKELVTKHTWLGARFPRCGLDSALVQFVESFTASSSLDYEICVAVHLLTTVLDNNSPEIPTIFKRIFPVIATRPPYTPIYDTVLRLLRKLVSAQPDLQKEMLQYLRTDVLSSFSGVTLDFLGGCVPCLSEGTRCYLVQHHYADRVVVVIRKYITNAKKATVSIENDPTRPPLSVLVTKLVPFDEVKFLNNPVFEPLVTAAIESVALLMSKEREANSEWDKLHSISNQKKKESDLHLAQFNLIDHAEKCIPLIAHLTKAVKVVAVMSSMDVWRKLVIKQSTPALLCNQPSMCRGWSPWYTSFF